MKDDVLQTIKSLIQRSLQISMKFTTVQTLMSSPLFDRKCLTPLMAQPYEVINVTSGDGDAGDQGSIKPYG